MSQTSKIILLISATTTAVFGLLWLLSFITLDLYTVIICASVAVSSTSFFKYGFNFLESYLQGQKVVEYVLENYGQSIAESIAAELSAEIEEAVQDKNLTVTIKLKSGV